MVKRIDAIQRALKLRQTLLRGDKLLVADFSETLQGKDTSRVIDLMPDVETGNYVFRAKVNVKDIDPIAASNHQLKEAQIAITKLHANSLILLDDKGSKTNLSINYFKENNFKIIYETNYQVLLSK